MTVRAKFIITGVKQTLGQKVKRDEDGKVVKGPSGYDAYEQCRLYTIEGNPVYGNGDPEHENTKFWESSPSGSLMLGTVNEEAAMSFEIGKEYYIDFTPAGEIVQNSSEAGMAWSDIAGSSYRAYAASTGNKNYQGLPMPAFIDLPKPIRQAWEAAARHAVDLFRIGSRTTDVEAAEQFWSEWTSPSIRDEN